MRNRCCIASVVLAVVCVVAVYAALDNAVINLPHTPALTGKPSAPAAAGQTSTQSGAAPTPGAVIVHVVSVHDGDTFTCDIEDYPDIAGRHIGVRINGIDTPEINDKRQPVRMLAKKAREYSARRLEGADSVELRGMERDKYFRILADVYVDGVSLADELVSAGLAKPYDGGRKPKW